MTASQTESPIQTARPPSDLRDHRSRWRRRFLSPVGISLGLHALALGAGLYLWTAAPEAASSLRPTVRVGALVECVAPGEEDCLQESLPPFDELMPPPQLLDHSPADEATTRADSDLPLPQEWSEARLAPAQRIPRQRIPVQRPFFEVPLDAIRVRVPAEPDIASEPTPQVARTPPAAPKHRAASPATRGTALRILTQPNVLNYYPLEARRRGIEGRALVLVDVNKSGRVIRARVIQSTGYALLDRQAIRYLHAMRFHPGSGGQIKAPVHFRLS